VGPKKRGNQPKKAKKRGLRRTFGKLGEKIILIKKKKKLRGGEQ